MPSEEFLSWYKKNSTKYMWDNYFEDLSQTKTGKGERVYKGMRLKRQMKTWEGLGHIKFKDGSEYQGFTAKEKFNGRGRMTQPNGDVYQGDWKDGVADGKGVFIQKDAGVIYDGDWKNDLQHGKGTEEWDKGEFKYVGDFVEGKKTGKGVFTAKTGNVRYEGDFVDGKFEGNGKYINGALNKTLEGKFKNNHMKSGKIWFQDGSWYEGELKNDMMNGSGVIRYPNGDAFVGSFVDDKKHGTGSYFDMQNGYKLQEDWVRGDRKSCVQTTTSTEEMNQ